MASESVEEERKIIVRSEVLRQSLGVSRCAPSGDAMFEVGGADKNNVVESRKGIKWGLAKSENK